MPPKSRSRKRSKPTIHHRLLAQSALSNVAKRPNKLRVLITAGPTREYIDPVRYLSNASTGKMGYAIAAAAAKRGHTVTLISGPVDLTPPPRVNLIRVISARDMLAAATRAYRACDAAVFAAAVCDYRPRSRSNRKMAKSSAGTTLELVTNPDIAATLGRSKNRHGKSPRVTIGFALEDHHGRVRAAAKLWNKHFDAIVLNSPAAIGASVSRIELLETDGRWTTGPKASKALHALQIVLLLERLSVET